MENNCNKKKRKTVLLRSSLIALAAVMLLCGSYLVTSAFLHHDTNKVENVFYATGLATTLEIVEKKQADTHEDGIYDFEDEFENSAVTAATYLFAPGVQLQKRVYVKIGNLQENAYLYVIPNDSIRGNALEDKKMLDWKMDPANWLQIDDNSGKNRMIYVYIGTKALEGNNKGILVPGTYTDLDVIENDCVTVSPDVYDIRVTTQEEFLDSALTFSVYLAQATGFKSAQEAWDFTHGK